MLVADEAPAQHGELLPALEYAVWCAPRTVGCRDFPALSTKMIQLIFRGSVDDLVFPFSC